MTDDKKTEQLENRIDTLENTIEKMMPSRRDALKMGGAALIGGAAMSGTASAGSNQRGTIGDKDATPPKLVDLHSEDIDNADTVTTDTLDATTVDTDSLNIDGTTLASQGGFFPLVSHTNYSRTGPGTTDTTNFLSDFDYSAFRINLDEIVPAGAQLAFHIFMDVVGPQNVDFRLRDVVVDQTLLQRNDVPAVNEVFTANLSGTVLLQIQYRSPDGGNTKGRDATLTTGIQL